MAKTPISVLQEYCVKSFIPMPIYSYEDRTIPSTPCVFACRCVCDGKTVETVASSKKVAKQNVAEMMLEELKIPNNGYVSRSSHQSKSVITSSAENYIGELNEYCSKNGFGYATYSELGSVGGVFQIKCCHQSLVSTGMSSNKKDAKQKAAYKMLEMIGKTDFNKSKPLHNPQSFIKKSVCREYSDEEIIEMYKKITLNNNMKIKSEVPVMKDPFADDTEPEPKSSLPKRPLLTAKYAATMKEYDPYYKIDEIGKNPIVLVFTLSKDKNFVLMEMGENREEVEELLLSKALEKLKLQF